MGWIFDLIPNFGSSPSTVCSEIIIQHSAYAESPFAERRHAESVQTIDIAGANAPDELRSSDDGWSRPTIFDWRSPPGLVGEPLQRLSLERGYRPIVCFELCSCDYMNTKLTVYIHNASRRAMRPERR